VTANIAVQEPISSAQAQVTRRWIAFDAQWCRTCRVCETVCAITHEGAARPALARIRVTFDEFPRATAGPGEAGLAVALDEPAAARYFVSGTVCLQCVDAPCVESCPTRSLSRDAHTGAIVVDTEPGSERACIGCMRCRTACPWDVPVRHPERKVALKCDLCAGREGGPVCVEMCPLSGRALRVEEAQEGQVAGHARSVTTSRAAEEAR